MRKYLVIYEEAVSYIRLCNRSLLDFLIYGENFVLFFINVPTPSPYLTERCVCEGGGDGGPLCGGAGGPVSAP
jgi:hypothetical protein